MAWNKIEIVFEFGEVFGKSSEAISTGFWFKRLQWRQLNHFAIKLSLDICCTEIFSTHRQFDLLFDFSVVRRLTKLVKRTHSQITSIKITSLTPIIGKLIQTVCVFALDSWARIYFHLQLHIFFSCIFFLFQCFFVWPFLPLEKCFNLCKKYFQMRIILCNWVHDFNLNGDSSVLNKT